MDKKKQLKKNKVPQKTTFDSANFVTSKWVNEKDFLEKCCLQKANLTKANISWQELAAIYLDHEKNLISLQSLANTVSQMLQRNIYVTSTRTRVKDPFRLLDKILRKRGNEGKNINYENYKETISDLAGVRVLHVLKTEWRYIHKSIIETFKLHNDSVPIAYLSRADEDKWSPMYKDNGCNCFVNSTKDYKSVHYDIEIGLTKIKTRLEIQVRTLNEEAWGELDHKINYPNPATKVVGDFIKAANMLSSTADEFSQHIILVNEQLTSMADSQTSLQTQNNEALHEIETLMSNLKITRKQKEDISKALEDLRKIKANQTNVLADSTLISLSSATTVQPLSLSVNTGQVVRPTLDLLTSTGNAVLASTKCSRCGKNLGMVNMNGICSECLYRIPS